MLEADKRRLEAREDELVEKATEARESKAAIAHIEEEIRDMDGFIREAEAAQDFFINALLQQHLPLHRRWCPAVHGTD